MIIYAPGLLALDICVLCVFVDYMQIVIIHFYGERWLRVVVRHFFVAGIYEPIKELYAKTLSH